MRIGPKSSEMSWQDVCDVMDVDTADLELWVAFGAPYLKRGRRGGAGWKFSSGQLLRWTSLMASYMAARGLVRPRQTDVTPVLRRLMAEERA